MNNLKRRFAKIAIALLLLSPIAAAQRPASTPRRNYGGGHHTQSLGGRYNGATNSHHKDGKYVSLRVSTFTGNTNRKSGSFPYWDLPSLGS
jgi:hypothetical protein